MRQRAYQALNEYQTLIEQYNYHARKKITDIFPSKPASKNGNESTAYQSAVRTSTDTNGRDKVVNI